MEKLLYILVSVSILFASCDEYDSDINIKAGESKLVLNGYISPNDTVVRIYLTQTVPTIGTNVDANVYDGTIVITDGVITDTMHFDNNQNCYTSNMPIMPSTTYTFKATTPDGRWAEASCTTIPNTPLDFNYTLDSIIDEQTIVYKVTLHWKDSTSIPKVYYKTDAELMYLVIDTINQSFNYVTEQLSPDRFETMNGAGFNQSMSIVYTSNYSPRNTMKFMELHLLMVDEIYYNFDLNKKSNSGGFPNYEYSKLYSNVKNGFGIIASYNNHVIKPVNIE